MSKYKAVISDLDGTLLTSNRVVSEFSKEIINKIMDKGIKFYIATGRVYPNTKEIMESIGIEVPLITSNGSRVNDKDGTLLYSNPIEKKFINDICEIDYKKHGEEIFLNAYIDDEWIVSGHLPEKAEIKLEEWNLDYPVIMPLNEIATKEISKFFYIGEHEGLLKLERELLDITNGELNVVFVSPDCLEVFNLKSNKANAIRFILEREGIEMSEAVAFGDGFNDYEMLQEVGKGYVMGNAFYRLSEALPDNEVIGTCDEDAEAKKLVELFL